MPLSRSNNAARRLAAGLIDIGIGIVSALLLSSTLGMFFARRAVVMLRIGEPGTWWQGPVPLMLGVMGEVVYLLPVTLWLAWLVEPLTGATIGKRAFGLRICSDAGLPAESAALWSRSLVQTSGLWLITLGLLVGRWELAAVGVFALVVMTLGSLGAVGRTGRALHDRLTGTFVCQHTSPDA